MASKTPHGAPLWALDGRGRWRSAAWREWVRGLHCLCGLAECPNCAHGGQRLVERAEAAHWRHGAAVGMGAKPDDFFCYPLTATAHRRHHQLGQPAHEVQWGWVRGVWRRALRTGVWEAMTGRTEMWVVDPPDVTTEDLAVVLREAFVGGALVMHEPFWADLPF